MSHDLRSIKVEVYSCNGKTHEFYFNHLHNYVSNKQVYCTKQITSDLPTSTLLVNS